MLGIVPGVLKTLGDPANILSLKICGINLDRLTVFSLGAQGNERGIDMRSPFRRLLVLFSIVNGCALPQGFQRQH